MKQRRKAAATTRPLDPVAAFHRHVAGILARMPDELAAVAPPELRPRIRARVAELVRQTVDEVAEVLSR